jgi:hypothetical protein
MILLRRASCTVKEKRASAGIIIIIIINFWSFNADSFPCE